MDQQAETTYLDGRVKSLEDWRGEVTTLLAVRKERDKAIDGRFDRLEVTLSGIHGGINKATWVVGGVLLVMVARWVLSGSLVLN